MNHPDAWQDDVRPWYYGGTPPPDSEPCKLPPEAATTPCLPGSAPACNIPNQEGHS